MRADLVIEEAVARQAQAEHDQIAYRALLQQALAGWHRALVENARLKASRDAVIAEVRALRARRAA